MGGEREREREGRVWGGGEVVTSYRTSLAKLAIHGLAAIQDYGITVTPIRT